MTYEPYTKSVLAQNVKEGDVLAFCLWDRSNGCRDRWHLHRVCHVDSRVGYMIFRTDNDTATFIYQLDERVSVVQA